MPSSTGARLFGLLLLAGVLLAAVVFTLMGGGDDGAAPPVAVAPTASSPVVEPSLSPPRRLPVPLVTPIGTPGIDYAFESNRAMWLDRAEEMLALLSVLTGDTAYCANLCPLLVPPAEVVAGLNQRCGQLVLATFRLQWQNYPRIVEIVDAYDRACHDLQAASTALGAFVDTPTWRTAIGALVLPLAPVVLAGRSQPSLLPPPAGPTPSPIRAAAQFYPKGTLTGLPGVDKFLTVLYSGDLTRLADDAVFSDIACSNAIQGPGAIPCPPGTPDGGLISLLPFGSCSPSYLSNRDQLRERLAPQLLNRLYAVYTGDFQRGAVYGVALAAPFSVDNRAGYYLDAAGRLVAVIFCGGPEGQGPSVRPIFPTRGG